MDQSSHNNETWDSAGCINISSKNTLKLFSSSAIQIKDSATNTVKTLDQYPIMWSAIKDKGKGFVVFGFIQSDYDEDHIDYYPALRAYRNDEVLWTKKCDDIGWKNIDNSIPFTRLDGFED